METVRRAFLPLGLTLVILPLFFWELSKGQVQIAEDLKTLSPIFLDIAFGVFVVLAVFALKAVLILFAALSRVDRILLAGVALLSFALAFFVAPKTHRIYYDENIYLHIGQSIASNHRAEMVNFGEIRDGRLVVSQAEYNKQPNAYSYLLSLCYRIFGRSENLSFLVNNAIFALSSLVLFGIGYLLTGSSRIGLAAAAVFAVIPQNILWHNTTSAEPANVLFISLTVFFFLAFLKIGRTRLFFLTVTTACLAAQFRLESILVFPLLGIFAYLEAPKKIDARRLFFALPLVAVLLFSHVLHILVFQGHSWGASQDKLSLFFVRHNLQTNGLFFLDNKDFPLILTLAAVAAFLFRKSFKEKLMLLFWFFLFWGVFLFFYAGSYGYGADVRFALMSFPPLGLLAGMGLSRFEERIAAALKIRMPLATLLVAVAFFMFLPKARAVGEEAWAARADHRWAKVMSDSLPPKSIVFTHNPNMFLFWGKSAAQASILAEKDEKGLAELMTRFPGGIFFHYNFWCNVDDPLQRSFCRNILDKFAHKDVLKFQERTYTYILYRLGGPP